MGRIFCIAGKSGSGKDTLYSRILAQAHPGLTPVVPYTTRPKRDGEADGESYYFVSQAQLDAYEREGRVVEKRTYNTVQGLWTYFTLQFDLAPDRDYLLIITLEGVRALAGVFGEEAVHTVYLLVDDRIRLLRCVERESRQRVPDYAEVCRRFLADEDDFSKERLSAIKNLHILDASQPPEKCLALWREIYNSTSPSPETL